MTSPGPDWTLVPADGGRPAYHQFNKSIDQSPQDDRKYRLIQLENGLRAALVSDATGDKAAASLDVAVGHLHDPDDMPGMAHFCEHLLFLGTEQFPRENEYSEYLAKNNGSSNAYTSTTNTNYYFNVGPPALSGALSRFSGFFHSPLFSSSGTARELNAVDSEHKKNHQTDVWRMFQTNKHLSKDGHVWRKFGTGNQESLTRAARNMKRLNQLGDGPKSRTDLLQVESAGSSRAGSPALTDDADGGPIGRETRHRLVEWWNTEYCASRMRLAVIGKDSLDELTDIVVPLFAPIKNRGQEPLPQFNEHPFGPNESGTLVSVQTIMDFHVVEISFPFEWQPPYWRHSPASFLAHLVGHEGPGSLHSYLKSKGWVTDLSAGPQNLARGFAMFKATIHLTELGFLNYRSVILATFKYLSLLRSSTLEGWRQAERSLIAQTRFRFLEKGRPDTYTTWLTDHMAWPIPPEHLISGPRLVQEWDTEGEAEADMRRMLESLRATRGRAFLMAKPEKHDRLHPGETWDTEPIYGTKYLVKRFDDDLLTEAEAENDIPELYLPGHNEFIPANLDVDKKNIAQPATRPFLVRKTPSSSLWHKKDDQFWVPKAHLILQIMSPSANGTARKSVLTRLWADLVTDSLTEYAYDAEIAGLNYSLSSDQRGIFIVLSGYNDKLHVLARRVIERIKQLDVKADRLVVVKENVKRNWQNFFLGKPYEISNYFGTWLLTEKQWLVQEKLGEIDNITPEDITQHISQFLTETYSDILIVGNMDKEAASTYAEMAEEIIGSQSISPSAVSDAGLVLREGSNNVWSIPVPNPNETNSAITYVMHVGDLSDPRLRVATALLTQLLQEPAFNVLRTQETLGYIVSLSASTLSRDTHTGIKVFIQSERKPGYLEERIEAFLSAQGQRLRSLSAEEFAQQKDGLKRKWLEKLKNLREETNRYWRNIEAGHLDFHRRTHDATLLDSITLDEVLAIYDAKVDPASKTRSKVSVHLKSQKSQPQRASVEALDAFDTLLKQKNARLEDEHTGWRAEVGAEGDAEPLASAVSDFWRAKLEGSEVLPTEQATELQDALKKLADAHPSSFESEGQLAEGVVYISDPKEFKTTLEVAREPRPLVDWNDLQEAKL